MISHHHDKEFTYNSNGQLYFSIEDGVASEFYWYGNQLRKIKKINDIIEFQYDDNGYRVSKTIYKNGIEISNTKYIIEGNKILKEIKHFNDDENDYVITYIYDGNEIIGFKYNNSLYIYNKNILGEINEIICRGNVVATYKYDAWGVPIAYRENGTIPDTDATFIGNLNSIKYKGYVYDVETGLFWVSSRYYSPELARFIQPADVSTLKPSNINGLNLYSYANNNPIDFAYSNSIVYGTTSCGIVKPIGLDAGISYGNNLGDVSYISLPLLYDTLGFVSNLFDVFNGIRVAKYLTHIHGNPPKVGWYLDNLSKYGKISGYFGYAAAAVDGINVYINTNDLGLAGWTIAYDVGSMIIASKLGGLIGGSIGGPTGAIIGTLAGIAIEAFIQYFKDYVVNWVDKTVDDFIDWISKRLGEFVNA